MVRMVASAVCDGPAAAEDELDAFDMGPGQVFSTAFHPDMSMVAASYQDGTVPIPVNMKFLVSVCLPACLSVCLPACLSVCLPVCLSVYNISLLYCVCRV